MVTIFTGAKMPSGKEEQRDWVQFWDELIVMSLRARRQSHDSVWARDSDLVRNAGPGQRRGNVAAEFVRVLYHRMLYKEFDVGARSDNPETHEQAQDFEVVANSVSRVAGLLEAVSDATEGATWATTGWLGVGHPLDPHSLDISRSFRAPNMPRSHTTGSSQWEPISPEEVENYGDIANVLPFDPFDGPPQDGTQEPEPVMNTDFGTPWVESIDPRLMLTLPLNVKDLKDADAVVRLHFLTREEMRLLKGWDYGKAGSLGEWRGLFQEVTGLDANQYPEMIVFCEVWIKRDRNNPRYNGWHMIYVLGEPESVVVSEYYQYGAFLPVIPLKLMPNKKLLDPTLARELAEYADLYDMMMQKLQKDMRRMLADKYKVGPNALQSKGELNKLMSDSYRGPIRFNDMNGVELVDEGLDQDLIRAMLTVKSMAQHQSGSSDLDRGNAIKDITARQTQALLDATGINVDAMAGQIEKAATETTMKLMFLLGYYGVVGRARQFVYGRAAVTLDRGKRDMTSSFLYKVSVEDRGAVMNSEEMMVFLQFLRQLNTPMGQQMAGGLDPQWLLRQFLRRMGFGTEGLRSRTGSGFLPEQAGAGGPESPMGAASQGNGLQALDGGVTSLVGQSMAGQHPEREPGDRGGIDIGNLTRGSLRVGSGGGE